MSTRTITGPHFITTEPSLITCRCGQPILAATVGGLDKHIDPTPLTEAGELAALLTGRSTYDLAGARRDHLIRRDIHRIHAGRQHPVLAEHRCGAGPAPGHVDHAHLQTATDLVRRLLGGQVITTDDNPPY